jgi:hypothetical protein
MDADPDSASGPASGSGARKAPEPRPQAGVAAKAAWAWLALPPEDLLRGCRQARFQGSGPGGQKRNRVYSGVRLSHPASGLTGECVDSRASARNVSEALARLRLNLALAAVAPQGNWSVTRDRLDFAGGPPFRPGANPAHADYPRFALRALHLLNGHGGQLAPAAASLGCTASALTRFFKAEKAVWAKAREIRVANGLHPLK